MLIDLFLSLSRTQLNMASTTIEDSDELIKMYPDEAVHFAWFCLHLCHTEQWQLDLEMILFWQIFKRVSVFCLPDLPSVESDDIC